MTDFLSLHKPGEPLLIPNPWDRGSAKLLVSLGYKALATTSSGFAMTLGRLDGGVTRDEALAHAADIAAAVDVPVSADLENCFADDPEGAAETVRLAREAGIAGCSIEDWSGSETYAFDAAVERVAAAAQAAEGNFVLTARTDMLLHGSTDHDEAIARLQAFERAGADVVYAPGLTSIEDVRRFVEAVSVPVNVLALPGLPPVSELAAAGVARISVGGGFAFVAADAVVEAARELLEEGTYGYFARTRAGGKAAREAFS